LDEFNKCGELKDMRFHLAFAALAATTVFASPASAQATGVDSDTIQANALLIQPVSIQRLSDLNFGTLIATPTTVGTATVTPAGVRTVNATTSTLVAGPGAFGRGRFIGNGVPGQIVALDIVFPAYLSNSADPTKTISFSGAVDADATDEALTIGATGVFYVDVGGTISIAANQMPGLYSGDVTVTADFQ
jgi:hypothetical protein